MEIFDYDNILLLPRKCRVDSRSECDASVTLGGRSFRIPVVPANMKTVVSESICAWMADKGYPVPPRSACGFCPFHSDNEWIRLRDEHPVAFEEAALFEERLQEAATRQEVLNGKPFLHSACIPLRLVPFKTLPANQQISLFGNECEGMCGV